MVMATFSVICAVAVLFLLRFLFALESETRTAPGRSPQMIKVSSFRAQSLSRAVGSAPALTLVHSDTSRRGATLRSAFMGEAVPRARNSQYKRA